MKNKGIKIGVVFILLFALLSVVGCQYDDVVAQHRDSRGLQKGSCALGLHCSYPEEPVLNRHGI